MHYRFAIINMCDECRMTLVRNEKIVSKYKVEVLKDGGANSCQICGLNRRLTKNVLTDYHATSEKSIDVLREKSPRTLDEGFALLRLEDEIGS